MSATLISRLHTRESRLSPQAGRSLGTDLSQRAEDQGLGPCPRGEPGARRPQACPTSTHESATHRHMWSELYLDTLVWGLWGQHRMLSLLGVRSKLMRRVWLSQGHVGHGRAAPTCAHIHTGTRMPTPGEEGQAGAPCGARQAHPGGWIPLMVTKSRPGTASAGDPAFFPQVPPSCRSVTQDRYPPHVPGA